MRSTSYALMAVGLGMTLWFASLAWLESAPSDLTAAPLPGPTPAPMTRISPERAPEPIVAHRPVPGYPPRPGTSQPGTQATRSGAPAHP
jgi:hypothetical protein